ncbi:hypothetical protein EVAR_87187_1 [Eumeta japonica]|uniref:Uncharacterized protein n=1 Tax=Eumeta variegata TaxID=151549 RepID=A0A4C1VTZ8_EUMVA|nr:hypothetical protein EVAR_87187_1 [Eumeta japonica]
MDATVFAQLRSYAATLKLPGAAKAMHSVKKPNGGPVLAFYPVTEQENHIKTADDTKLLKKAIDAVAIENQKGYATEAAGDGAEE